MIKLENSNIFVLQPVETLDYFHTLAADAGRDVQPLEAWNTIMAQPLPGLRLAFRIRDAISALFGVERIGGFSGERVDTVQVGERLDFFLVEHSDPHALVLTGRDTHLDVMTCVSTDGPQVSVTSSVKVHNRFGRVYMLPVGIAHKWIVRAMLRRLKTG